MTQNVNTQISGFTISNINGSVILENGNNNATTNNIISDIDISSLAEGIYIVKIFMGDNYETHPLVVIK